MINVFVFYSTFHREGVSLYLTVFKLPNIGNRGRPICILYAHIINTQRTDLSVIIIIIANAVCKLNEFTPSKLTCSDAGMTPFFKSLNQSSGRRLSHSHHQIEVSCF